MTSSVLVPTYFICNKTVYNIAFQECVENRATCIAHYERSYTLKNFFLIAHKKNKKIQLCLDFYTDGVIKLLVNLKNSKMT